MPFDILVDLSPLDSSCRYSGTGRYVSELGRALAALDTTERRGLSIGALGSIEKGREPTCALDWPGSTAVLYDDAHEYSWLMQRRRRLPGTLRRLRPRLFHATFHMGTPRGSLVPRVVTCLDLVRLVLSDDYLRDRWAYRRVLMATEALRFHSARRVLAISQHTADDLVRVLRVPARKIDVALLGVDLDRYHPPRDEEERSAARAVRERYTLVEGGYIFYVGRADPRKNVDVLVRAFAAAAVDGLELVIMGDMRASDRAAWQRALLAAGRPAGVRFLGFVPEHDLPWIIGGALGFVFCSTYEGFGNVPVEAMACGCPAVTTGLTSMAETVGDAGLRVPARDVAATADAIRRLATESSLRAELRDAGIARAQRFGWRNTALATIDCYERALR